MDVGDWDACRKEFGEGLQGFERWREVACVELYEYERKTSKMGNNASELELGETKQTTRVARLGPYLSPLRIEIIVTDNGNCEIIRQTFLECF